MQSDYKCFGRLKLQNNNLVVQYFQDPLDRVSITISNRSIGLKEYEFCLHSETDNKVTLRNNSQILRGSLLMLSFSAQKKVKTTNSADNFMIF